MTLRRFRAGLLVLSALVVSTLPAQAGLTLASGIAAQGQLKPTSAEDHLKRGDELRAKKDWDGAIAEYREAISIDPKSDQAHVDLGVALQVKGDWGGAVAEWREAVRLNPKSAGAHHSLGFALENKGDFQGALNEYRAAYTLEPQNKGLKKDYKRLLKKMK